MSYSVSLPKRKEKGFSKKSASEKNNTADKKLPPFNADLLAVDLFCHLTYMSALATADLPRNQLFEYSARLPYTSSKYIRSIFFMAKRLNYDYAEACEVVGSATKEAEPKALLLRMSGALASGEKESDFLAREAFVLGEKYGDDYEKRVESLKNWTDAFVALILSASLVVVISVVSMLIFPSSPTFIVMITWLMLMTTGLGVWIMYRATPKEIKTHTLKRTSKLQDMASTLFKYISLPLIGVIAIISLIFNLNLGGTLIAMGIALIPGGFFAVLNDRRIDKIDTDIAAFLRSLGGMTKAIGTTVTEAVGRLDFNSLGSLKNNVKHLNDSLVFGIRPDLCWKKFVEETGSEQVNRSVRIFWDANAIGGDPGKIGNLASLFAMKVYLLRGKRQMIAGSFSYLVVCMHAVLSILLIGIYNVLLSFSEAVGAMSGNLAEGGADALMQLPTFAFFSHGSSQLQLLNMMVTAMVVMLTCVDSAAIKVVEGGHNLKIALYLGLMMCITGASMMFVPGVVHGVFTNISVLQ
jgi:archaeal flagellar protein FlaJ